MCWGLAAVIEGHLGAEADVLLPLRKMFGRSTQLGPAAAWEDYW